MMKMLPPFAQPYLITDEPYLIMKEPNEVLRQWNENLPVSFEVLSY
ncbi:MAG: hypothetical protein LBR17_00335 [Bacteroidales bacterium]|jgi:hypothetical protein|nr:hypothetical protein [Bacteroidales bacterium]